MRKNHPVDEKADSRPQEEIQLVRTVSDNKLVDQMQTEEESGGRDGGTGDDGEAEVRSYKILVLGNSGAGKTSLVRRSVRDYFSRDYRLGSRSGCGGSQNVLIQTTMTNEHCSL